jgi:Rrf2 family protein
MLSKKAQYALKALAYLAKHYQAKPVLITEVAEKKKIPLKFLESILLGLKRAGILDSKMGKGGGYFLRLPPETVSLASVIRVVDGPIAMLPCVSLYFYRRCDDCNEEQCNLQPVFEEARDATLSVLEKKTLMDIVDVVESH